MALLCDIKVDVPNPPRHRVDLVIPKDRQTDREREKKKSPITTNGFIGAALFPAHCTVWTPPIRRTYSNTVSHSSTQLPVEVGKGKGKGKRGGPLSLF